eukprot:8725231-Pyramimonas_sp.AAC.1
MSRHGDPPMWSSTQPPACTRPLVAMPLMLKLVSVLERQAMNTMKAACAQKETYEHFSARSAAG